MTTPTHCPRCNVEFVGDPQEEYADPPSVPPGRFTSPLDSRYTWGQLLTTRHTAGQPDCWRCAKCEHKWPMQ